MLAHVHPPLKGWAAKRTTYGYRRLYHLLRREGHEIYAIYKKNKLAQRRKKKKRFPQRERKPLMKATKPNEIWAMDFMADSCGNGRKVRTLNIIDRSSISIE